MYNTNKIKNIIDSMRPEQWIKNLVIFAGIVFSSNLFNLAMFLKITAGFIIFCFISGAVYIFNDICDKKYDKGHPAKAKRPIPAERLKVTDAWIAMIPILFLSLVFAFILNIGFGFICILYSILQFGYSISFKHLVILDVISVATGYVLRAFAGTKVIGIEASNWFIICVFLVALFMALGKRRAEFVLKGLRSVKTRTVLSLYGIKFIDQMISVVCASTILAYCLYVISEETVRRLHTTNIKYTIPFVIYGMFRYLFLIYNKNSHSEKPEKAILFDKPLLLDIALWASAAFIILYIIK